MTPHRPNARAKALLLAGLMLMAMGQTVLFALLGPAGRNLGLSEVMIGAIISLAAIAVVVASSWWGRRADIWGRRPVFLAAMAGLSVATLGFTLTLEAAQAGWLVGLPAFAALALARVIYGLTVSGAQPAAAGWFADITPPEARTAGMATIGAAYGIGTILGPSLAWAMSDFDLLAPLYLISLLALGVFLAGLLIIPETRHEKGQHDKALSPADPRVRITLVMTLIAFTVIASVQQTVAFFVQDTAGLDAAMTASRVGQAMALLALVMLVTQITVASVKPAPGRLIIGGTCAGALGCIMLVWVPGQTGILCAHACFGLGFGALVPGLQGAASLAVSSAEQGATGGLIAAAMAAGYVIGPLLGTSLYMLAGSAPYVVGAALMLAILTLSRFSGRDGTGPKETSPTA